MPFTFPGKRWPAGESNVKTKQQMALWTLSTGLVNIGAK